MTNAPSAMMTSPTEKTFASGSQSGAAQRSTSHGRLGSVIAVEFACVSDTRPAACIAS